MPNLKMNLAFLSVFFLDLITLIQNSSIDSCCQEVGTKNSLASLKQGGCWRSGFSKIWWLASMHVTIHSSWAFRLLLQRLPLARRQKGQDEAFSRNWVSDDLVCYRDTSWKLLTPLWTTSIWLGSFWTCPIAQQTPLSIAGWGSLSQRTLSGTE